MKKFLLSMAVALMAIGGAKAEEEVLFEGSEAVSWDAVSVDPMTLTATDVTLVITFETTTPEWFQIKFCANVEGWPSINLGGNEFINSNNIDGMDWSNAKTYTIEYELDADQIAGAKTGLKVQGSINKGDLLLKKVVAKDKVFYQEPVTLEHNEWWQIESKAFEGYSDDAKITFTWTSEGTTGYVGWGAGSLKSVDETVDTGFGFSIKEEGTNTFTCVLSDIKDALDAGPSEYGMYGIMWNMWNHGNDACVDTRVSVTIAEIEGFSGTGYVAPANPTGIEAFEAAAVDAESFNLFGQKSNGKGFTVKGGKIYLVK